MTTSLVRIVIFGLLLAPACKDKDKGGETGESAREELAVGPSGFVISAPKGAEVKTNQTGFYSVKGGGIRGLQISESSMSAPASAADLANEVCAGQSDIVKETLPTGGFFVQCKGPSQAVQNMTTSKVASSVPAGEGKTLRCQTETDQDPGPAAAICRSLRKK